MFHWKKYLPTLILLLLVYTWYFAFYQPMQHKQTNVLGAKTGITLFEQPQTGRTPIVDAINSAQKEIMVEVYLLSDKQIIQALEDAKARGVNVYVMLEQHPLGASSLNEKSQQELSTDGIQTEWSDPNFSLTHEKAIIIDANQAFILSQNLTASSFSKNREHDVLDTNSADVAEVRNIFMDDWERKQFTPPSGTNIIESPDNSRAALTTLINSAQTTIDAEAEDIDDQQLISLFEQKAKTERVRLLMPTIEQLSSNEPALKQLAAAGVEVKTISSPYMHAKMILADDQKAYVGSINFSTQSVDSNREVGIILTQPESLQTLKTDFDTDWQNATTFQ